MSLLSDDEEWKLWNAQGIDDMNQAEAIAFARAYAAAILAKMARAELPEPEYYVRNHGVFNQVEKYYYDAVHTDERKRTRYTADQLRQAYAQGAAAQLAEKPLAYFYHDASCPEMANPLLHSTLLLHVDERNSNFKNETPLYTRREA